MSMYAHILSSVPVNWVDELTGTSLLDYTLECRTEMLESSGYGGYSTYSLLAAHIAYDRALCKLCQDAGISIDAISFTHPLQARAELESALATAGLDLVALTRTRRRT